MTNYYVRADGNDSAAGTSDATAWKSITQVRTALANRVVRNGDALLFRRGDTFPGVIGALPPGVSVQDAKLLIGAYGIGARPILDGAKVCNSAAGWTLDSSNIWKIDLSATGISSGSFTGNVNTPSVNVGFLKVNGTRYGNKKSSKADLSQQWDFFDEGATGQYLYVYSTANPTSIAADIRAAVSSTGISVASSCRLVGLHLRDYGGHGVRGDGSALDVGIYGCRIEGIGGAYLSNTTRFGNGIEAWVGSRNWEVRGNEISDVFDTAMTMQGPIRSATAYQGWENCHWLHNTVWDSMQALEVWSTVDADAAATAVGWVKCSYRHNLSINIGNGWASPFKRAGLGTHLLTYSFESPADIDLSHNTFFGARDSYYYRNTGDLKPAAGYKMHDNTVLLAPGTRVSFSQTTTIENASDWVADTQHDFGTRFYVVPSGLTSLDDVQAYLASNMGFVRGEVASLQDEMRRSVSDRVMLGTFAPITSQTFTLTPLANFWEVHPNYGPVTATLVGNTVFLSGAIRRMSTASSANFSAGVANAVAGTLPASMIPTFRRRSALWVSPNGSEAGRVAGFVDQGPGQGAINIATVAASTLTAGSAFIVFDGVSYQL